MRFKRAVTGLEHRQDILNSERKIELDICLFLFTIVFILLIMGVPLGYEQGVRVTMKLRLKHKGYLNAGEGYHSSQVVCPPRGSWDGGREKERQRQRERDRFIWNQCSSFNGNELLLLALVKV